MTRLQEVEKLLDNNLQLITDYTKRAAELIGSVRQLEKEREKLTKKNRGLEVIRCLVRTQMSLPERTVLRMDEYISREEAIKELREVYEQEYPTASGDFDEYASHDVPNVLRNMKAADVQHVKRGRWIWDSNAPHREHGAYKCSNCGCHSDFEENYCYNCGARMEQEG